MNYAKSMVDKYGDIFTVGAEDGAVVLVSDLDASYRCADLVFEPSEALKLARRIVKAAEVALASR